LRGILRLASCGISGLVWDCGFADGVAGDDLRYVQSQGALGSNDRIAAKMKASFE
jgi:hypothetical protein